MSAAVILKTSYRYDWNVGRNDFLDYMERPAAFKGNFESIKQEVYDYMNYMSNEDKSDGLFTADKDVLSVKDVAKIREDEKISSAEGCPKYLGVISFDNNFLRENGLIIGSRLDTEKLRTITRKAIAGMIDESDKLQKDNCYWTASIHMNTDNIHVHFQLLEYHRVEDRRKTQRGKGQDKIEKSALEKLKSIVANEVINEKRTPLLTSLMRNVLIPSIGQNVSPTASVNDLLNSLPETNKAWQYNRAKLAPYRSRIDACVDEIINSNDDIKKSFETFKTTLQSMSNDYERIYGNRNNCKVKSYAEKQMIDFYARAGNALLKELYKIKTDSGMNLSGGSETILTEQSVSEKNAAGLKKKKFKTAKKLIENGDEGETSYGLGQMRKLSLQNPYARDYLAFYYYRHRDENEENRVNAFDYLKRSFDESGNMTACYLLGKLHIEKDERDILPRLKRRGLPFA